MLKYHVAVCDDEKSDLDGIVQSVQRYDVQGCFDIETYMDGNELLSELQMQKKSFDLLLLDIEILGMFIVPAYAPFPALSAKCCLYSV